jgi:hypothetical protein
MKREQELAPSRLPAILLRGLRLAAIGGIVCLSLAGGGMSAGADGTTSFVFSGVVQSASPSCSGFAVGQRVELPGVQLIVAAGSVKIINPFWRPPAPPPPVGLLQNDGTFTATTYAESWSAKITGSTIAATFKAFAENNCVLVFTGTGTVANASVFQTKRPVTKFPEVARDAPVSSLRGADHGSVVAAALLPGSKENTSVIVQNNGTAPATIVMDVYRADGTIVPGATNTFTNAPVGGTRTFAQALNEGLTPGFRGVGQVSSDQPINALEVRDIESTSGLHSYSVHNAYPVGGNVVTLPYVSNAAADGVYNTRFAVANTGTSVACVTISYAFISGAKAPFQDNGPGGGGCTTGYAIPVDGQIAFAPTAIDGAIPMPAQTRNEIMGATISSNNPIVVGVDAFLSGGSRKLASYDGFIVNSGAPTTDDVGTTVLVPLAAKIDGFYTQILVSNVGSDTAAVTITYKGNSGPYTVNLSVPANGAGTHSVYQDSVVPENFIGAATITSTQPIAAVLFRIKMTSPGSFVDEDLYTAVNGIPTDRASTTAKLPLVFRRIAAGGGASGYNTWYSVAVADGGTANVTINSITDTASTPASCGAAPTYSTSKTINGSAIFYQNADSDNGFGANPACFWGGVTITSDRPIIAIANVTSDLQVGDNDGLYNAFGS